MAIRVNIIDDESIFKRGLECCIEYDPRFEIIGDINHKGNIINYVKINKPNIIIINVDYSIEYSLELIYSIKQKNDKIKILVFTRETRKQIILQFLLGGADGFLSKDATCKEVTNALESIYGGNEYLSLKIISIVFEVI